MMPICLLLKTTNLQLWRKSTKCCVCDCRVILTWWRGALPVASPVAIDVCGEVCSMAYLFEAVMMRTKWIYDIHSEYLIKTKKNEKLSFLLHVLDLHLDLESSSCPVQSAVGHGRTELTDGLLAGPAHGQGSRRERASQPEADRGISINM